jgi:hypothetical protein
MNKGFSLIGILIVVGIMALFGGSILYTYISNPSIPEAETPKSVIEKAEEAKELAEGKNKQILKLDNEASIYEFSEGLNITYPSRFIVKNEWCDGGSWGVGCAYSFSNGKEDVIGLIRSHGGGSSPKYECPNDTYSNVWFYEPVGYETINVNGISVCKTTELYTSYGTFQEQIKYENSCPVIKYSFVTDSASYFFTGNCIASADDNEEILKQLYNVDELDTMIRSINISKNSQP